MWKKTLILIFCFLLTGICFVSGLFGVAPTVYAADVAYSNVLDDLRKDSNFDESYYVENEKDYGLSVITLAESTDNDLYVYVFQPTADKSIFLASYINIAVYKNGSFQVDEDGELLVKQCSLQCVSSDGGFFKYKVLDYDLLEGDTRPYEIVSIFRPYIKDVDENPSGNNTVNHVVFPVGKLFTFSEKNGQYSLTVEDVDTIKCENQYVGFVRYKGTSQFLSYQFGSCDSHFIAFSSKTPIDKLLEATVLYKEQIYSDYYNVETGGSIAPFGSIISKEAFLDYRDKVSYESGNWFYKVGYEWARIQRTSEFVKEFESEGLVYTGALFNTLAVGNFTSEAKENLSKTSWVLRFAETDYIFSNEYHYQSIISNVTILRLKFETDGEIYNLGAVSNIQTGSSTPAGKTDHFLEIREWVKWFFLILGLILLGVLLSPILTILKFLWSIIKIVLDVVFAPFRWIFGIRRSRRRRK